MICSKHRLNEEMKHIEKLLPNNGCSENVVSTQIATKASHFSTPKRFASEKCHLYLGFRGLISSRKIWIKKLKQP